MSPVYEHLMETFSERIARSRARLHDTWEWKNHDRPAVIISDVNYALCGQRDVPPDYYNPEVMFEYQMAKIYHHMQTIPDDYVPVLHPWYGTTVVPSAFGVPVVYHEGLDPSLGAPVLEEPEDISRLKMPDFEHDGQFPQVLACIDYMRSHTDVPVCVTDGQGPLNIALSLAGVENLFYWMYDEPEAVHELMNFCADVLIEWVKVQKRRAGHSLTGDAYPHAIEMPSDFGGVAFADDDIGTMSPKQYQDFVIPCNAKVLKAFGGGSMHFCGSANQHLDIVTATEGLHALNNFCMGDFDQIRILHKNMKGRGALMACDFNAASIPWHMEHLKELAKQPEGLILGIFCTPGMALLENGKYTSSDRTIDEIVDQYLQQLREAGILPEQG